MADPSLSTEQFTFDDAQASYDQLTQAAEQQTDPAAKAALLEQRDAMVESVAQLRSGMTPTRQPYQPSALAPNVPPPPTMAAGAVPVASSGEPLPAPAPGAEGAPAPAAPPNPLAGMPTPGEALPVFMAANAPRAGNPAEVRRQRAQAAVAKGIKEEGQTIQLDALAAQRDIAANQGQRIKEAIEGGIQGLRDAAVEKEQLAQDRQRARDEYLRGRNERRAALEREQAAQGRSVLASMSDGDRVASAIIVGLGGFAQGFTGSNRNAAHDIIMDAVNHEVDARAARLAAGAQVVDEWDRQFAQALQATGSIDAAKDEARALRLEGTKLQIEAYAAYFKGQDTAAAKEGLLGGLQAEIAAADQRAAELAARRAGGSRGDAAKALKDAAAYAKAWQDFATSAESDYLDSNAKTRINQFNTAEANLNMLEQQLLDFQARGYTELPGRERLLSSPAKLGGRLLEKVLGTGGSSTGLAPDEERLVTSLENTAVSTYVAEAGNSANLESEAKRAIRGYVGNGTIESALLNVRGKRQLLDAQRRDILRKHTPSLREQQQTRQDANAPTQFPGAAPPAGATRVGKVR